MDPEKIRKKVTEIFLSQIALNPELRKGIKEDVKGVVEFGDGNGRSVSYYQGRSYLDNLDPEDDGEDIVSEPVIISVHLHYEFGSEENYDNRQWKPSTISALSKLLLGYSYAWIDVNEISSYPSYCLCISKIPRPSD